MSRPYLPEQIGKILTVSLCSVKWPMARSIHVVKHTHNKTESASHKCTDFKEMVSFLYFHTDHIIMIEYKIHGSSLKKPVQSDLIKLLPSLIWQVKDIAGYVWHIWYSCCISWHSDFTALNVSLSFLRCCRLR